MDVIMWYILLALSCSPSGYSPALPNTAPTSLALPAAPAAFQWRALDHLADATLELPPDNLPDHQVASGVYILSDGWSRHDSAEDLTVYVRDLPITLPPRRYRSAPAGLILRHDGEPLEYRRDLDRRSYHNEGWVVISDRIYVALKEDPEDLKVPLELVHPALPTLQSRFNYRLSGLEPADFASLEVTIDEQTRPCLFLPAPGRATWSLRLPAHPHLNFATAVRQRADLAAPESDGVTFQVLVDGTPIWSGSADADDPFADTDISLENWGGKQVSLTLATQPGDDATNDLAVFGSPTLYNAEPDQTRRIVVIGIDTLRPDHLGIHGYTRDTSPEMDAFASSAFIFDHARAPAPRTKPSFRTAFTGLYPLPAVNGTTFGEVLRGAGFATGGISGNVHLVPRFGFSDGFDYWFYENGAKADDQVDRALAWLDLHHDQDAFLFVHIMDPHIFYKAPGSYKNQFVEQVPPGGFDEEFNRWTIRNLERKGELGDVEKKWMESRYDGEVRFVSAELGRLFTALDALPGRTLVLVHTDHGEEFWDHGGFEHNHTLYDELVHTVLWVRPPGGLGPSPVRLDDPVNLMDIAPTLYSIAGIPADQWPPMDGTNLQPLLDAALSPTVDASPTRTALAERPQHISYLMYDTECWAVVYGEGKYILQTVSGDEELYDLTADPGEQTDLAKARQDELPVWRQRLAAATGWPVGPGWRIDTNRLAGPLTFTFPVPVADAGVIDPEAGVKRRANLEWGEKASKLAVEVATVVKSEDGMTVSVTPGPKPRGTLYVLFGEQAPEGAVITAGDVSLEVGPDPGKVALGPQRLTARLGTLIVPGDSMVERIGEKHENEEDMEALRALGYVE